ncbi:MAG: PEP-CTERM sorting domain-containing protein, partial [Nitrospirae bacterium]|nr:PEP-CTERM sorting domain-containing protein [Fimbriimonadaceae bacterium]
LVSAFDFNGTLNPYVDNNPPNVQPLEARTCGSPTSSTTPNFMMDTVNAVSKQVAVFAGPDFFRAWHGIGANGGGAYVNRYSVLMDVMHTKSSGDTSGWASFFNTTSDQGNDGDWTPGRISALGFFDGPLGDTEAAALGVAGDPVPEPATMSVMTLGVLALLRKRRKAA